MPPRKSKTAAKAASSDSRPANSRWVRCPRSPCLVSFNPRSAPRHASTCRYFRCSNQLCNYLGTQNQVDDHQPRCPHGLSSDKIGTTDPLSESVSEVLDILTSPHRFHSYPTDISSTCYSESSPRKCLSSSRQSQQLHLGRSKASKKFLSKPSKESLIPEKSIQAGPIASTSSLSKGRTLDPYDPSAQRVFALPLESINPSLRPAAPPPKSSSPVPPPPTRRLSTYELQRYRPDPQPTKAVPTRSPPQSKDDLAAALAHKTVLYESLKSCFQSLLYTYDDYIYLVSQKVTQLEIPEEIVGPAINDFRQAYHVFLADKVPDLSFLNGLDCNATEECLDTPIANRTDNEQVPEEEANAEENLTADQLADQVRVKIAELKRRRSPPGMDSPGNLFSRKRQRDESVSAQFASSPPSQRPTRFMRKLADTTWELSDEIQGNLPSRCNFKKVIDEAQLKIQKKVKSRKSF